MKLCSKKEEKHFDISKENPNFVTKYLIIYSIKISVPNAWNVRPITKKQELLTK